MQIKARGWSRDSGPTLLVDREVCAARTGEVSYYERDVLYLERTMSGVELRVGPVPLTLGGKYQIEIQLTTEDITELFLGLSPELSKAIEGVFTARRNRLNRALLAPKAGAQSGAAE
jgi:hypothetical protein